MVSTPIYRILINRIEQDIEEYVWIFLINPMYRYEFDSFVVSIKGKIPLTHSLLLITSTKLANFWIVIEIVVPLRI